MANPSTQQFTALEVFEPYNEYAYITSDGNSSHLPGAGIIAFFPRELERIGYRISIRRRHTRADLAARRAAMGF